jgi:hypothetical protein
MAKKVFGLASLKVADIASDGGMGTNLITLGETVKGTMQFSQEDNTTTEFEIEESDSPVESIISAVGKLTAVWSSHNIKYYILKKLFGGTGNMRQQVGSINVLGAITAGTLYTNGFYEDVPLTGGAGSGARANITIGGGGVTNVELTDLGSGYAGANNLSVAAANVGGTGSGFSIAVTSVFAVAAAEKWEAPDSFTELELSMQLTDKKGSVMSIPRAKIAAKLNVSFSKEKLGQLDFSATVLQPTKSGEKRLTIVIAN